MKNFIVAIGGGKMYTGETLLIDKQIVKLSRKKRPHALFIPTASKDNPEYCDSFKRIYKDVLGCNIDYLLLCEDKKILTKKKIKEKIEWADIIYVSGGNTIYMMKAWRSAGVDEILKEAYEKGKILAGMSAGSICWFDGGFSDSFSGKYIVVKGLGLINAYHCPHYDSDKVKFAFLNRINNKPKENEWYLLDDNTAIVFDGKKITLIKSKEEAKGYKMHRLRGGLYEKTELVRK